MNERAATQEGVTRVGIVGGGIPLATGAALSADGFDQLLPPWDRRTIYLIVLLRLAVLLHRGRSSAAQPGVRLSTVGNALALGFPEGWLEHRPLTRFELEEEAAYLKAGGFSLEFG